jgi:hypothetical protein
MGGGKQIPRDPGSKDVQGASTPIQNPYLQAVVDLGRY